MTRARRAAPSAPAGPRPVQESSGELAAGEYETATTPRFRFRLRAGWRALFVDRDEILLGSMRNLDLRLGFNVRFRDRSVADVVQLLLAHSYLRPATGPTPVAVGGADGQQLEMTMIETVREIPPLTNRGVALPGAIIRFYVVAAPGGTVIFYIVAHPDDARFGAFRAEAESVLSSVSFVP